MKWPYHPTILNISSGFYIAVIGIYTAFNYSNLAKQTGWGVAAMFGLLGIGALAFLAEQLDALGYEAEVVEVDGHTEVQAWNCVFHSLARAHPDVCRFDLAFMGAATGRTVQRTTCMLHGQPACRFRLGGRAKAAVADDQSSA